jgi:hypothetical protein
MFFTADSLREKVRFRHIYNDKLNENLARKSSDSKRLTVFLSHSHSDLVAMGSDMIEVVKKLFGDLDIEVYIDAFDPDLPRVTSGDTANLLKTKIQSSEIFVLVATQNAVNSKWVPWELGFADSTKGLGKIAILPIADKDGRWTGSEYLQIYHQIRPSASGNNPILLPPGAITETNSKSYKVWADGLKRF